MHNGEADTLLDVLIPGLDLWHQVKVLSSHNWVLYKGLVSGYHSRVGQAQGHLLIPFPWLLE